MAGSPRPLRSGFPRVAWSRCDVTYPGREAFEGWLRTTRMPYLHRVKPKQRQLFLDRYLELHPISAQGLVHVGMVNLLVKATKA
jgi:trans-aconitate 2-methyltransferase